jgi:hypothetical protein
MVGSEMLGSLGAISLRITVNNIKSTQTWPDNLRSGGYSLVPVFKLFPFYSRNKQKTFINKVKFNCMFASVLAISFVSFLITVLIHVISSLL